MRRDLVLKVSFAFLSVVRRLPSPAHHLLKMSDKLTTTYMYVNTQVIWRGVMLPCTNPNFTVVPRQSDVSDKIKISNFVVTYFVLFLPVSFLCHRQTVYYVCFLNSICQPVQPMALEVSDQDYVT